MAEPPPGPAPPPSAGIVERVWTVWLPPALVVLGVLLRIRQYAARRSMWNDEAALALNLVRRGYRDLLEPLDIAQGAPLGFLWAQRTAINVLGNNEFALRLLPLLMGVASVVLFALVARRLLTPWAVPPALLLFAVLRPLVYYSAEAKQYSSDVAVTLLLLLVTIRLLDRPMTARRAAAWGAVACVSLFFSHPAMFVIAACTAAIAVVVLARGGLRAVWAFLPAPVIWGAGLLVNYVVSLRNLADNPQLAAFWADGYAPEPLRPGSAARWVGHAVAGLVPNPVELRVPLLVLAVVLLGAFVLLRRRPAAGLVLAAIAGAAIMGGLLGLYPLKWRLALYLVPLVLLVAAAAVDLPASLRRSVPALRAILVAAVLVPAVVPVADAAVAIVRPYTVTEMRTVLEHVRAQARPGDAIYVHWTAAALFDYYAPVLDLRRDGFFLFNPTDGPCPPGDALAALRAHRRVWAIFAYPPMYDPADDAATSVSQLEGLGRRVDRVTAPGDTEAHLFEVGTPPVAPSAPRTPHPGTCFAVVG